MNIRREIQLVNAFLIPAKRERYVEFLSTKKGRTKFLEKLYHFADFDPTCIAELSGLSNSADGLVAELRGRGAIDQCYVMSVLEELDGVTRPLEDVIREVFASAEGTIVCCVPGMLAYYEGEAPKNRFILRRQRSNSGVQRSARVNVRRDPKATPRAR